MKVEFQFEIDQSVQTPFDEEGIIDVASIDDGGKKYYVKTKRDSQWYKEAQLTALL